MKSNVNSAPSLLWSPFLFKSKLLNYGVDGTIEKDKQNKQKAKQTNKK